MTDRFESALRKALTEANLSQCREIWENMGAVPTFSPRYRRERARMLSDPFGWMRRKLRPLWKTALRNVACILLASLLALGALMAASSTVRAAVVNWLREFWDNFAIYRTEGGVSYDTSPAWRPGWLPDGEWSLTAANPRNGAVIWMFERGQARLTFYCSYAGNREGIFNESILNDDTEKTRTPAAVHGRPADYYEGEVNCFLVWRDGEKTLFGLSADGVTGREMMERIAESVYAAPDASAAYALSELPAGWETFDSAQISGVGRENLRRNADGEERALQYGETIALQYVQDPPCPFRVPPGTPEEVSVNGLSGRFWSDEQDRPGDPAGHLIINGEIVEGDLTDVDGVPMIRKEINGVTVTFGDVPRRRYATLAWTDPETNTAFRLRGTADKETLLEIAECVRRIR